MENKKSIAIVPGSFDPITYGHIDIAKRAAEKYDQVYFAVMINSSKNYMFSMEQRVKLAEAALSDVKNITVISYDGMLWKLCQELDAVAIVKGYRNKTDYDYEMNMAQFNSNHFPQAKTVLLLSDPLLEDISSTEVRKKLEQGESLCGLMPQSVIDLVYKFLKDNKNNLLS